jgi:AcrR family transcriptional regulator
MVAPLPDHVIERLRQMHAEGATYDEICEALGIGRTTLKRYIQRLGLPARQTPIALSADDRARLAALYADPTLTTDAICAAFGFSPATLNRYVTEFQLPPRGKGYGKVRTALDETACSQVRELFLRTPPLPLAAIAEQAQLPLDRVRRIIDDLHLTRTPPRRNRKLTSAEEETFRQFRREGLSLAAIAARLGISESHAGRLAKRLDATRPSLKRMLSSHTEPDCALKIRRRVLSDRGRHARSRDRSAGTRSQGRRRASRS